MDPVSIAQNSLKVGMLIYQQAMLVKSNEAQAKRLGERVNVINEMIQKLIPKLSTPGFKNQPQNTIRTYTVALTSLKQTLEDALALVQKLSASDWMFKIFRAGSYTEQFNDIYTRLEQDLQQLNIGLSIEQVINREEDKKDRLADYQSLISKQDEILRLNQVIKQDTQKLALDEANRHTVLMQQMESMRFFMENLKPTEKEKPPISQKLLVPFYDLSIDSLLAKGSFGNVYLGRWLQQEVAIKMLEGKLTEADRKEFIREVKIMKRLRHKHVMSLYAVCDEPGRCCLVMEYMHQGSLRSLLDKSVALSDEDRHNLIVEIASGLYYLHSQGILHRDFKSANVLIDKNGSARIADFGLSRLEGVSSIAKRADDIQWMAPEVIQSAGDNRVFSEASDVYSFGVVVWEILTGKAPYAGLSMPQIVQKLEHGEHEFIPEDIPKQYQDLLHACWSKERYGRPSMASIVEQLQAYKPASKLKAEKETEVGFYSAAAYPSFAGAQPGFWQAPRQGLRLIDIEPDIYYRAGLNFEQEKDAVQAVKQFQKASAVGYPKAKTSLAMHYMQGTGGLTVDKQTAHRLLTEAAEAGHARGMRALAYQYEKGDGVSINLEAAKNWYEKAATAGDDYAKKKLKELGVGSPGMALKK